MVSDSEGKQRNNYTPLQHTVLDFVGQLYFGSNLDADATLMEDAEDSESGNEKAQKNQK